MNTIEIISTIRLYGLMLLVSSLIWAILEVRVFFKFKYLKEAAANARILIYGALKIPAIIVNAYCTFQPTDVYEKYLQNALTVHLFAFGMLIYLVVVTFTKVVLNGKMYGEA